MTESEQQRVARMRAELDRQRRKNESDEARKKRKKRRDFWRQAQNGE